MSVYLCAYECIRVYWCVCEPVCVRACVSDIESMIVSVCVYDSVRVYGVRESVNAYTYDYVGNSTYRLSLTH